MPFNTKNVPSLKGFQKSKYKSTLKCRIKVRIKQLTIAKT